MTERYDAIVVGAGQAGPSLAMRLASAGRKTAIVERSLFGGTCVNTGCIPTKTLHASARVAHLARHAADYGALIDAAVRVDMARVRARKDALVGAMREGLERALEATPALTVIRGHARLAGARRLAVGSREMEAGMIFLNVGARAQVPDLPGVREAEYLTNSTLLQLGALPAHLVVVGGGYVGVEFAQMYRRFGAEVTLVQRNERLVPREDDDVSLAIRQLLELEGVAVRTRAECIRFARRDARVVAGLHCAEEPREVEGSHVLLAVGRRPNTDDLGLEASQVEVDERGYIKVDDELRTSAPGIWALGEANGRGAFTHTSYNDYEIVAANLLGEERRRVGERITAYAIQTDPPLGRAGLTEREARAAGHRLVVRKLPMSRVSRARMRGEAGGFMKVLLEAGSRRILGAAVLGIEGDEVIHALLDTMYAGAPAALVERAVHIHPTVSEYLPTLLHEH